MFTLIPPAERAEAQTTFARVGGALTDDFKYVVDNAQLAPVDIVSSSLHIAGPGSVLRSPRFYLV